MSERPGPQRRWIVDGNNVLGARPDRWWNDRVGSTRRLTQRIAEWCRTHDDRVAVVFDPPLDPGVAALAGGNLTVEEAARRGRDAADHRVVELASLAAAQAVEGVDGVDVVVVTSDRGLVARLLPGVRVLGAGTFRSMIDPTP